MKKITENLNNISINAIIAKQQSGFNNYGNGGFSSFLKNGQTEQTREQETASDNTNIQTQVLHKEAYLNKLLIESVA